MIIKEYLSVYLKLDPELIVGEANLYTLGIRSLFFQEQAAKFGLTQIDFDPQYLKSTGRFAYKRRMLKTVTDSISKTFIQLIFF